MLEHEGTERGEGEGCKKGGGGGGGGHYYIIVIPLPVMYYELVVDWLRAFTTTSVAESKLVID